MTKKKVCVRCKMFTEEGTCPNCGSNQFSNSFQGRIYISNPEKSTIAKKIGITRAGEYAIKVK